VRRLTPGCETSRLDSAEVVRLDELAHERGRIGPRRKAEGQTEESPVDVRVETGLELPHRDAQRPPRTVPAQEARAAQVRPLQAVGGAAGNMICVHNVVAASAVVGLLGKEGPLIRKTIIPMTYYLVVSGALGFLLLWWFRL